MSKFRITMKDPDGAWESVDEAAKQMASQATGLDDDEWESLVESKREKINKLIAKWFEYGEYLTVEVDTEAGTIRVVPRGE